MIMSLGWGELGLPLKDNRGQLFYFVVLSKEESSIKSTRVSVIYKLWREKIIDPLCVPAPSAPNKITLKASAKKKKKKGELLKIFLNRIVNTCYNLKPV